MRPDVKERARAFVAKARPSIAGQHGHDALFAVACGLVVGFALGEGDAMDLLHEYNAANCAPAWGDKDLRRKYEHARRVADRDPSQVGYLADADRADYTGPRLPANKEGVGKGAKPVDARGGAPPKEALRTQRTARTPLFTIRKAGEGAKPRTARTVRTPVSYSFTQETIKPDVAKSSKQPSVKSAPEPRAPPSALVAEPMALAEFVRREATRSGVAVTLWMKETGRYVRVHPDGRRELMGADDGSKPTK